MNYQQNTVLKDLLYDLFHFGDYSDVTFVCDDGKQIKAHKFMLSECSNMFRNIFAEDPSHTEIFLPDISHHQMESILEILYLGRISSKRLPIKDLIEVPKLRYEALTIEDPIYIKNVNMHEGEKYNREKIKCTELNCEKTFKEVGTCNVHIRSVHEKERFKCTMCDDMFAYPRGVRLHIESVHLKKKFPCRFCNYKAADTSSLSHHERKLHENTLYDYCDYCPQQFNKAFKANIKFHMQNHHVCNMCTFIAKHRNDLDHHKETKHGIMRTKRFHRLRENHPATICKFCNKTITINMETHMKSHHNCGFCSYIAADNYDLKEHKQEMHPEDIKKFICEVCKKCVNSLVALHGHLSRYHYCNNCNFIAKGRRELREHKQDLHPSIISDQQASIDNIKFIF